MRILKKSLPFKKSNDHLALRYLALGHSKRKALFMMLGICFFYCLCGVALLQLSQWLGIALASAVVVCSVMLTVKMGKVTVHG